MGCEVASRSFTVPLRTISSANAREHYAVKAKRLAAERSTMRLAWLADGSARPTFPAVVTLTRVSPRLLDSGDNLPVSMKAPRDELAAAWGIDDRDPCVEWRYAQRKGRPKEHAVEVSWMPRAEWIAAEIARLRAELGGSV
jgi:hypothetical protein